MYQNFAAPTLTPDSPLKQRREKRFMFSDNKTFKFGQKEKRKFHCGKMGFVTSVEEHVTISLFRKVVLGYSRV